MNKIAQTQRLYLRELDKNDAESFYALNLDADVLKHTGDKPFSNIDEARSFLVNYDQYSKYGFGRWAVILKEKDEFIGWCGLKKSEIGVDLGFRFFKKHWNKGYATEAAKACLEYGVNTLKINEIIGRSAKKNTASITVLEKIGMKYSHTEIDNDMGEIVIYYS